MQKEIIIDGNNFSTLKEFYEEIENKFTKDLGSEMGRNFDALNDVFKGGFGVHEYEEAIVIIWKNSEKSKKDLGYNETILYFQNMLKKADISNTSTINNNIQAANNNQGDTLYDIIINIIGSNKNINLVLS